MEFLKKKIEEIRPLFEKGGKYEKFYFLYEAHETLLFQPKHVAGPKGAHIRDAVDLKRVMTTVILALLPCLIFGMWNAGFQHYENMSAAAIETEFGLGVSVGMMDYLIFGAIKLVPIIAVCYMVGLGIEFTFATIRRHPVSEGFLVTGILIPLVVPYTIPLWEVALATAFAVILGKEVFGGTGYNLLNPALTARAFLFFAYPAQISGNKVWIDTADGVSGATVLGQAADSTLEVTYSFSDMLFGFIPGSIGETSAVACAIGALILIATGVGSWRIMLSMLVGGLAMSALVENVGANPYFGSEDFYYHIVAGGFMFGLVFMATDPVSAAHTNAGKIYYGLFAGALAILVRFWNPAYPEGVMLAILLANVFAPLFDYFVISSNKKRRLSRATV